MAGPLDLIPANERIATSQAPQGGLTPQQIKAPYYQLAENLTKAGEVTDTLAVNAAEYAGSQAVTRDADGNLQVQKLPILGPASEAFARAARFSYLAKAEPEIDNKLAELRLKHINDPRGYQEAARVYGETYLSKVSDPTLRAPVEKIIGSTSSQHYRALLNQADQLNVSNTLTALKSRISDASNKLTDLAYQGGTDTEEYRTLQGNVSAMYRELGTDPRMGYPQARIDSELSEMTSQHKVMSLAGQAVRMTDSDSPTARADAKKFLIDKIYGDKGLNLTMAQRHQAVTTAMGLMEARSAESKALIDANKAQVNTILTNLRSTQPYNPAAINDVLTNAAKIGDAESFYKVSFAKSMHDWNDSIRNLPMPQQVAALRSLDTARLTSGASTDAMNFFTSKGYTKEQAAGIVGHLIQESGLNPNTVHDNGTGLGIAGHRLERLDAMKAFAAARGRPVNDFQTQLEFIDKELNDPKMEGAVGQALRAARTPQEAAHAFMSFERPAGWTAANPERGLGYGNRVANAVGLAGGSTGAGRAWFEEARLEQVNRTREYLKGQAGTYVDTVVNMLNKAGDVPDHVLQNVSDVLRETGQDELRRKVDVALMAHYGVKELDKLPESTRRAWATQAAPDARDSVIASQVHGQMQANIEAGIKAMGETPYSTYAMRTRAKPPEAYNFEDPGSVAKVATARAGAQAAIQANDRTGPISVFEGKEADAFGNVLTNGESAAASQSLQGLASLPTDIYQATVAQKPVKDAITGMMGSKDPLRMSAAMQAADKLWRESPADAEATLGGKAMTKMQAWQALRGTFTPAEIAERLNASDDPSTARAREAQKELAEKETDKLKPEDMAYKLGTSWGIPILSRVANVVTGATPAVPFDSIKGGELVADYKATYTALRTYGVDADKASELAVQRLGSTWGISAAAGNQVMKNPPERAYPAIDGSHDWMGRDLKEWITRKAGPEFEAGRRSIEAGFALAGSERKWSLEGLIADGQTQAEIAAGKPPSYQVAIKKADGTLQIMDSRIGFDPSNHITEHGNKLEQRRQALDFLRTNPSFGNPAGDFMGGS